MNTEETLRELGLNNTEVKIYLASLKLGISSVYKISEETLLPRSTCYDSLKSLQEKGLIASLIKNNKKHFEAANPEKIISQLEEKKSKIKEIIPSLNKIKESSKEKPKIKLFIGKEGIKTILESVLNCNKDFSIFGNFGKFKEFLDFYSDLFVTKRIDKKLKCKLIEEKSEKNILLKNSDKKELRETKFLSGLEAINSECFIFGDKIAFIALSKEYPFAILIENEEIANLQRKQFEQLWKQARK